MTNAKEFVGKAERHLGEHYVHGAIVPVSNPNWNGPWDCAEFVTYIVYYVTGKLYGYREKESYTGYWAEDARKGTVTKITLDEAVRTDGAILLRIPSEGRTGHIAFSNGKGGTVEARGKEYGVCKYVALDSAGENSRGWNYGIRIPGVDYGMPFAAAVVNLMKPLTLTAGDADEWKKLLNIPERRNEEDDHTMIALYNFQLANGLEPSGFPDEDTINLLKKMHQ
jgi:hypothetical protein